MAETIPSNESRNESKIIAALAGRDQIQIDLATKTVRFEGCKAFSELVIFNKNNYSKDPHQWPLPKGTTHAELLVKEFLLKLQGNWNLPYKHDEICHCRLVSTQTVLDAIAVGAHTPEVVSRWTTASTACGTCRPDVEKLIQFRLSDPNDPR